MSIIKNVKQNKSRFKYFGWLHINFFFFFIMLFFSTTIKLSGQTISTNISSSGIKIHKDSTNHKVDIQFTANIEIINLLVLISDSVGRTVFLDNQYHFKGNYKHTMNFKETGKGKYFLKIIRDEDQFDENLFIE